MGRIHYRLNITRGPLAMLCPFIPLTPRGEVADTPAHSGPMLRPGPSSAVGISYDGRSASMVR